MSQSREERMADLAEDLSNELLAANAAIYTKKWRLKNKSTGKLLGKYIAVIVFKVDEDIFDGKNPGTKATGLPAREGTVMQSTRVCPCCKGSGVTSS